MANRLSIHKRKISQFSLTKESIEILEALSRRYGCSKSIIIDRALQYYAGKNRLKISISYDLFSPDYSQVKTEWDDDIEKTIEIAKSKWTE